MNDCGKTVRTKKLTLIVLKTIKKDVWKDENSYKTGRDVYDTGHLQDGTIKARRG